MGKLKQGILGGFSGKVGSVVGSSWRGISVMKAMPLSVANPRTEKQMEQRNALSFAVAFSKDILADVIKPLNDRFAKKMSGYNRFIKMNIEAAKEIQIPAKKRGFVISKGCMGTTAATAVYNSGNGNLTVNWGTDLTNSMQSASDRAFIVVTDSIENLTTYSANFVTRSNGSVYINVRSIVQHDDFSGTLYVYVSFLSEDGRRCSNTTVAEVAI